MNHDSLLPKLVPGAILGFLVFVGLALVGDIRQVSQMMVDFDWRIFPLVVLLTTFNDTLRFIKWHLYIRLLGIRHINWLHSLQIFAAGLPLSLTPGKVGEALKGVWLKQRSGVPVGRGVSVVVAERISDGLAVLGLSMLGVMAYPQYWVVFVLVLAALLGVVVLSQSRPAALWLLGWCERLPLVQRFVGGMREFYEGSFSLFQPRPTLTAISIGLVSWLGEGVGFYLILRSLGLPASRELLGLAVFVLAFSTVVGAVSALPAGLGAVEVSVAGMLTLLAGIDPAIATSATILVRLATLWFGVTLGLIVWGISPELLGLRSQNETIVEG